MPGDDMAASPVALDPDMQTQATGSIDPYATVPTGARTRVTVDFTWDDETFMEKAGAALGFDSLQVKRDLNRFREFIEDRGSETGAWRGRIDPAGPLG